MHSAPSGQAALELDSDRGPEQGPRIAVHDLEPEPAPPVSIITRLDVAIPLDRAGDLAATLRITGWPAVADAVLEAARDVPPF